MELINQPFNGQLGNRLIELINSQSYHTLNIAVAFAKNSGVLRMKDAIEKFRERGGKVNVYVGIDMKVTTYEALTNLLSCTDSLNIVHIEKGQTFHSKIYQRIGKSRHIFITGSNNLTGGGLWTNIESAIVLTTDIPESDEIYLLNCMNQYFKKLASLENSFMTIKSQNEIDLLLQHGYIQKEVEEKINQRLIAKTKRDSKQGRLFSGGYKANLPKLQRVKKHVIATHEYLSIEPTIVEAAETMVVNLNDIDKTIWFETRKMTGGSRNILDLSKTSLVEKVNYHNTTSDSGAPTAIQGAVAFFDLDPSDVSQKKDIVINFDGVDYHGNTILYPKGKNANGTWRLQIKGVNSKGGKITECFRAKSNNEENYLVNKVISFTKIESNYYFMSIFPESSLEDFKESSYIVARNGSSKNSKYMGIF